MTSAVLETSVGVKDGDSAARVMFGAYLHAFRRFSAICLLVAAEAGEDAMILVRSLLSIAARAAYVDQPEDPEERLRRYRQYKKRHFTDMLERFEGASANGIEIDESKVAEVQAQLDELKDDSMLPPDRQLFELVGLEPFYRMFYRKLSDYQHFSLGVAVAELEDLEQLQLERPEPELARDALKVAVLTYGVLLDLSQKTLGHNLGERSHALVEASPDFTDSQ
jgi:hypothetical protein